MSEPLRVAVVGLGYWGPNLLRNLVELEEAEVVDMCDKREERLEHLGRRYPAVETDGVVPGGAVGRSTSTRS